MGERFVSRGFRGRPHTTESASRLPPGQYLEKAFPVLSAGPTPHTPLDQWDVAVEGEVKQAQRWSWEQFQNLPHESLTKDIHCVTKWTKLDTHWEGVSLDLLLAERNEQARFLLAYCDGGYTTNLPLEDVLGGKAWIVDSYEGKPIPPEHGGPARLFVPHLYFWKSAKWVRGLRLLTEDQPGFWEKHGYHNHGDPWKEERYWGD